MNLTFDKAIEILEIADISSISINDINTIRRNAQKRWHPDSIQKLQDEKKTIEYESNFKMIDEACVIIEAFLKGTYHSGQAFEQQETQQRQSAKRLGCRNDGSSGFTRHRPAGGPQAATAGSPTATPSSPTATTAAAAGCPPRI